MTAAAFPSETPVRPLSGPQKALIALASVAMGVGMTINFVVVTPLARQAGLSEIAVAAILTLSAAIYAGVIPWWARLAERWGRKRVMALSLAFMGLTNMAFLFALEAALAGLVTGVSAFALLVFVRVWFGLLSPGIQPASMAAMADASTASDRAATLGLLGAAMSIGAIIGPAGAAALAPFGALAPLWGSIVFCLAGAALVFIGLPPTRPAAERQGGSQGAARPAPLSMRDARVAPYLIFLLAYFTGVGMIQISAGWFIEDRFLGDASPQQTVFKTGLAFALLSAGIIVMQFGVIMPRKPDPARWLPLGLVMVAAGYLIVLMAPTFTLLCGGMAAAGLGAGIVVPSANALGSLSVTPREQGQAAALLSAAPPAGFVIGPLLGAALYMLGAALPFLLAALLMGGLGLWALRAAGGRPSHMAEMPPSTLSSAPVTSLDSSDAR